MSPIEISDVKCQNGSDDVKLKFHHVTFQNNSNAVSPGCLNVRSSDCLTLEIEDVTFENNLSGGPVILAQMSSAQIYMNSMVITNNTFIRGISDVISGTLMSFDSNDAITLQNAVSYGNTGTTFEITGSRSVNISHSTFEHDTGSLFQPVSPSTLNVTDSVIYVENCTFARNAPISIKCQNSDLNLNNSKFNNLNNNGYVNENFTSIYTLNSYIKISNCQFEDNFGGDLGSVLNLFNSNFELRDSQILNNTAEWGGAIYANCRLFICNYEIRNCRFWRNRARAYSGGAIRIRDNFNLSVRESVFEENESESYGGALAIQNSYENGLVEFDEVTFRRNNASMNGGAVSAIGDVNGTILITIKDSVFNSNSAIKEDGGALSLFTK